MNRAAEEVMVMFTEIWLAYGQSDEYSFIFRRDTDLFSRREEKIISCVVSCFSAAYVRFFAEYMGQALSDTPTFDARCICYPTNRNLRDYISWRQADCHINNLYNTCFWSLVQKGGLTHQQAEETLKGTLSDFKNEMLFTKFGINYAKIDPIFRKGTTLIRQVKRAPSTTLDVKEEEKLPTEKTEPPADTSKPKQKRKKEGGEAQPTEIAQLHEDLIQEEFWTKHCESLCLKSD
jgi:tRNA(His) guanylyltransferase